MINTAIEVGATFVSLVAKMALASATVLFGLVFLAITLAPTAKRR